MNAKMKRAMRDAKRLFRACVVDGVLDEERAKRAAGNVAARGRRNSLTLLRCFRGMVKRYGQSHTAVVESAAPLPPELETEVRDDLVRLYGPRLQTSFALKPTLIGGMRIRVGNDVYDGSVQARLAALEKSL
jgi:F-type H+-transporting ATPase subunit delta